MRNYYFAVRKLVEQVDCQHSRFTAAAAAVTTVCLVDGDRVDLRECVRSPNGKVRLETHKSHSGSGWCSRKKDGGVTDEAAAYLSSEGVCAYLASAFIS